MIARSNLMEPGKKIIEGVYSSQDLEPSQCTDPAWHHAQPIHITQTWAGQPAPESRHSEARILWTDRYLLARFICCQEEPLIVCPTPQTERKTVRLWDRDVCEIFVAPETDTPERYFEFEASPAGEWIDIAITFTPAGRETNLEFHSGMKASATILPGQTIITIAIPWSTVLPKPQPGDAWRVNLFRCVGAGDERYLAWQPTFTEEPNFHMPEAFGWLRFVKLRTAND